MTTSILSNVQDFSLASVYVQALGCDPDATPLDLRALDDTKQGRPAVTVRGTLRQMWQWAATMNAGGYGIFVTVNETDGTGIGRENIVAARAGWVDLDGQDAQQQYEVASAWHPAPSFAVATSPGRWHVYWVLAPGCPVERAESITKRLAVQFNGDRAATDCSRVLRLPGTLNWKPTTLALTGGVPHLVTCHALGGYGQAIDVDALDAALAGVRECSTSGTRHPLGDPALAAPSLALLKHALDLIDPNDLSRDDWISFTAAWKQAGWTLATDEELRDTWLAWCARYERDDPADNLKQWRSIRDAQLGWPSLLRRVPELQAAVSFGAAGPSGSEEFGEILTGDECARYFSGLTLIGPKGVICDERGVEYSPGAFNAAFGGHRFIITRDGRSTDEPWKAATRSTLWTVPRADGYCFKPHLKPGEIITDDLGRTTLNTYRPARIESEPGDPGPFIEHLARMIPDESDRAILIAWLAHNAKYPGFKIPWAPVIQSTEGAGKGAIKSLMQHAMGRSYVYVPKAKELAGTGGKFNGWMDRKLLLIADEIKVDDKRDLVEVLKTFISETEIEIEAKGADQRQGDNFANWLMFTNHRDAIPIDDDSRRYAIFYAAQQSRADLMSAGMGEAYFTALYDWLGRDTHQRGLRICTHWLLSHPIERGAIPMRAPRTTSTSAAIEEGRGWLAALIADAVEAGAAGFRCGWVNTVAVGRVVREAGRPAPAPATLGAALRQLGYHRRGQAGCGYWLDDSRNADRRGWLWNVDQGARAADYAAAQGYEPPTPPDAL